MKPLFIPTSSVEITLRPYQEKLIDETRNELAIVAKKLKEQNVNRPPRVIMRACTGLGKTYTSGKIAQNAVRKGKKTIFAVHRRDLVFQAYNAYQNLGIDCGMIMAGNPYQYDPLVQVASIDTIAARKNDFKDWFKGFDLIVTDEAHTSANNKFNTLRELAPNAFEIGLTATPYAKGLGDVYDSMVHAPDYAWAIDNGFLVRPRYIGVPESESEFLRVGSNGEFTKGSEEKAFEKVTLVGGIVKHYSKFSEGRPTVVFAPSVKASLAICEQFNRAGYLAVHIDADTDKEVRQAAYAATKSGEVQVLCNYGVLDRGFDLPEISCVIIMREIRSIATYIQMIGRGLRTAKGKTDCIVIDLGENIHRHGCFVDEPVYWNLDKFFDVNKEREEERRKEPKEIFCKQCKTAFKAAARCPHCGAEPSKAQINASLPETRDVELTEIKPSKKRATPQEKAEFYGQLLTYVNEKGWNVGAASHMFKKKFEHFPAVKRGISQLPITEDVKNWITSYNIAKAAERKKSQERRDIRL